MQGSGDVQRGERTERGCGRRAQGSMGGPQGLENAWRDGAHWVGTGLQPHG